MGMIKSFLGGAALLVLTFAAFFLSGALGELGFFRLIGRLSPGWAGMSPAFVDRKELADFSCAKLPDLSGKVALVTGANTGIGKATVMWLAKCSKMKVIMGCRSAARCEAAAKELADQRGVPAELLVPTVLDLNSLKSVNTFADKVLESETRLDSIVFNAGRLSSMAIEYTEDGIESVFGVNHLAHFLLWKRLATLAESTAEQSGDVRVVSTSSFAHYTTYPDGVGLSLGTINSAARYDPMLVYGESKLANLLFAQELAERQAGKGIYVNAAHPGTVATNFASDAAGDISGSAKKIPYIGEAIAPLVHDLVTSVRAMFFSWGFKPEEGAIPQTWLAASRDIVTRNIRGKLVHPITHINEHPHPHARNATLQRALWDFSERVLVEKGLLQA